MTGGLVSRLPPSIRRGYMDRPVLGSFLRLSADGRIDAEQRISPGAAVDALASDGIRFIVVDHLTARPALVEYVNRLGLPQIANDGRRELLLVQREPGHLGTQR
jgi:hypothetical protein